MQQLGHYKILSLIGAGGMGEVYLAQDTRLDRKAALKTLPADVAADQDRMQRFIREAKAASALNHQNVATIYDIGEADGIRFIAMEYIEGQTLAAKIGAHPLATAEIIDIGVQVADALDAAHSKGITHRDIKTANIMLTPRGLAKVLDFGLAKITRAEPETLNSNIATAAGTVPGVVMGTVQFMSPEQVLGRELDHRTDIFSLGVALYEMAAGRLPFKGTTMTETMDRVLHSQPDPIPRANGEVPAELERIIRKCLEKDRERRYQTARELLVDLKNLQRDSGSGAAVIQSAGFPRRSPSRRVAVVALVVAVLALGSVGILQLVRSRTATAPAIQSLAVLPFVNVGANPETEYLADGITDSIISNLAQLSMLKVMSRSSVFRYKGRDIDPQMAGRELKVEAVLAGRVVPRGDRLAISLELVSVTDNRQLWGEQYDRTLADVLRVQADISREVSEKLRLRLSGQEQQQLAQHHTANPEAYQLYLKGRFYWNQQTEEGFKKGIQYFNQAIEKDPNYAMAYVGLADSYIFLGTDSLPPREAMPRARTYALKALELNGKLAEAHASLGIVKLVYEWDWQSAEQELRSNLQLSPQSVDAFSCASHFTDVLGRNGEAIAEIKRALELDPLSLPSNFELGCASYYGRQYDQAIKQFRQTKTLDPNLPGGYYGLGRTYSAMKMYPEAIAELSKGMAVSHDWPFMVSELGYAYGASGKRAEAQKLLQELKDQAARRYVDPYLMALLSIGLGQKEETFAWLDKAYDDRSSWLPWLKLEPKWDSLHADPRFAVLVQRVGLMP